MSSNNTQISGGNIGFAGALFLVFLVLKLTGYIDWSWWWVTAPLWIPFVIFLVSVSVLLSVAAILVSVSVVLSVAAIRRR